MAAAAAGRLVLAAPQGAHAAALPAHQRQCPQCPSWPRRAPPSAATAEAQEHCPNAEQRLASSPSAHAPRDHTRSCEADFDSRHRFDHCSASEAFGASSPAVYSTRKHQAPPSERRNSSAARMYEAHASRPHLWSAHRRQAPQRAARRTGCRPIDPCPRTSRSSSSRWRDRRHREIRRPAPGCVGRGGSGSGWRSSEAATRRALTS